MDFKTLEKIRKKESSNKSGLSQLPNDFYKDCQEALDYAFKTNDYQLFSDIQRLVHNIHEMRQGKLLTFAIYRSIRNKGIDNSIENILPHEEKILNQFLTSLHENNEDLDVMLNGYYFQEVRT